MIEEKINQTFNDEEYSIFGPLDLIDKILD